MDVRSHVLIVEDDAAIGTLVRSFLGENGFRVSLVPDGRGLDAVLRDDKADLVVLDLMLPGEDGLSICRRLRKTADVPVIMLTALGEEADRIRGLELGADDYMAKPFNPRELLARIRAVLRRGEAGRGSDKQVRRETLIRFGRWEADLVRRQVRTTDGVRIALTSGEFDLLVFFCRHPGEVLGREAVVEATRGRSAGPLDRSVDVMVSRLRRKLIDDGDASDIIVTVRNAGYLFVEDVTIS